MPHRVRGEVFVVDFFPPPGMRVMIRARVMIRGEGEGAGADVSQLSVRNSNGVNIMAKILVWMRAKVMGSMKTRVRVRVMITNTLYCSM